METDVPYNSFVVVVVVLVTGASILVTVVVTGASTLVTVVVTGASTLVTVVVVAGINDEVVKLLVEPMYLGAYSVIHLDGLTMVLTLNGEVTVVISWPILVTLIGLVGIWWTDSVTVVVVDF